MKVPVSRLNPIIKVADAEALLNQIGETMVALVQAFEDETRLLRAGKLKAAGELAYTKTNLAARYLHEIEYMKANSKFIYDKIPELVDEMRHAHESFREILSRNLRIVATAQSMTQGVVRGTTEATPNRGNPHSYQSSGYITQAPKNATRRIIVAPSR